MAQFILVDSTDDHAAHNELSVSPVGNETLHGEKTALGVLYRLAAENVLQKMTHKPMKFYREMGYVS